MIDATLQEWLGLALRLAHVVTAIAWIGASFFFVWLDDHLEQPTPPRKGVEGSLWMIHSGGFYDVTKIEIAPDTIPARLHWFKWEAAWTFITGFLLLALVYYLGAPGYLIDPSVADLSRWQGIAIGIATLVIGWAVYDAVWSTGFSERNGALLSALTFAGVLLVLWALTELLSARAAFLHVGAMIGTAMVANVWMRIIPAQRRLVEARAQGRAADARDAIKAKQRSMHNSYATLPVLLLMLSGHSAGIVGHQANVLLAAGLMVIGAAVRHWFILRHKGAGGALLPAGIVAACLALFAAVRLTMPDPAAAVGRSVPVAEVEGIVARHCLACHAAVPAHDGFDAPPKGVVLETVDDLRRYAALIHAQTVASEMMPLGNETGMTSEERAALGAWIAQGARGE